ncbi:MAG: AAA family ATPase [Abditibacteriota bacterium]|nr:AAA family ATPase [Abditibacteriota bacterium]
MSYASIDEKYKYFDYFFNQIKDFGGGEKNDDDSKDNKKYVWRNNTSFSEGNEGAYYFGCINTGEKSKGTYQDLSIVIFPSNEEKDDDDRWLIALVVGSENFKNDYDIVSLPRTRRLFVKYLEKNEFNFIKYDFTDILTANTFNSFYRDKELPESLKKAKEKYNNYILASTLFDLKNEEKAKKIISTYLAIYAKYIRDWPSNKDHRNAVNDALKIDKTINEDDIEKEVEELIKNRKYVVLQGAPGTGKTRLAKMIPNKKDKIFFTQFHAETNYSDFVYGIMPKVNSKELEYEAKKGILVKAIKYAINNKRQNVYLIIDEINRANLSNVLGSAFYLFEPNMIDNKIEIEVCPGLLLKKLPDNLYVIATMNTADRSLAVVDFALRRRFAWYTLYPHEIDLKSDPINYFCETEFKYISDIFEKYATDEELNFQPGHSYFIVENGSDDEIKQRMKNRLKYEIMPLIKEYLLDGMLSRAKDDFINYFRDKIGEEMFK